MGVLLDGSSPVAHFGVSVVDDYTVVEWLEIQKVHDPTQAGSAGVRVEAANVLLNELLIHDFLEPAQNDFGIKSGPAGASFTIRNSIIYDGDRTGIQLAQVGTVVTIQNCTVYGMERGIFNAGTTTVTNTIAIGNTTDFLNTGTMTGSHNMSTDLTASTAFGGDLNAITGATSANEFVDDTIATADLHLKLGALALEAGTDLSPNFSDDIDAQARPLDVLWDMGADERPTANSCPVAQQAWFDEDWQFRKAIVVQSSQVTAVQTDFPVLINLSSDGDLASAQIDGDDIVFTASDGVTKLSHEIDKFDRAAGDLVAWVKVLYLSSGGDSAIYMYYGNGTVGNQEDVFNTWSNGYQGVWHLSQPSGTGAYIANSAQNDHHGTPTNTTFNVSGKIGGARTFVDSGDERINWGNPTPLFDGWNQFAFEFWVFPDYVSDAAWESAGEDNVMGPSGAGTAPVRLARVRRGGGEPAGKGTFQVDIEFVGAGTQFQTVEISRSQWNHIVYLYDGMDFKKFVDGAPVGSVSIPGDNLINNTASGLLLGGSTNALNGSLDEVRISNLGRTDAWIATEYNNQNSPATFYNVCSATTAVELVSFTATGLDGEVLLEWETGSELDNLGFHLYRSLTEEGPYERITASVIPGLGSSPQGAKYAYRDSGLANGVTYYYQLEDIETTGVTELHGPVSAAPTTEVVTEGEEGTTGEGSAGDELGDETSRITYGNPEANELKVRRPRSAVVRAGAGNRRLLRDTSGRWFGVARGPGLRGLRGCGPAGCSSLPDLAGRVSGP